MSENKDRKIIPGLGAFNDLSNRVRLIARLMGDSRVSPWLKLIPIGSVLYFFIPDLVIGPIDDVAILWLGSYLFVEMCPQDVVQEHMERLKNESASRGGGEMFQAPDQTKGGANKPNEDVIEGEFWEKH